VNGGRTACRLREQSRLLDEISDFNYTVPDNAQLDSLFIFPQMDPLTMEIALFMDSKLYAHFVKDFGEDYAEQELLDFSLALINNVYVLYQQPSISPNLDVVIVRYELWKTQPVCLVNCLCKYRNCYERSLVWKRRRIRTVRLSVC
jgi:hypothetical protein